MAGADSQVLSGSDVGRKPAAPDPGRGRESPLRPRRRGMSPRPAVAVAPPPTTPAADPRQASSRRGRLLALAAAPFTASLLLHVIVMLAMALVFTFSAMQEESPLRITASVSDDQAIEELEPLEIEPFEDHEIERPALDAVVDPGEIAIGDVALAGDMVADVADVGSVALDGDIGSLAGLDLGTGLGGDGDGAGAQAGVTFFGAKSTGRSFVFVVDNSNSMTKGRFETALTELVRAVNALGPKQQFYVLFYSDTAYGLFHPQTAPGLVPATDANKEKLLAWLYTVEMCLNTRGAEAMQKALALNPDVINVLGDGAFGDQTVSLVTAPHSRRTVINTFGMQVDPRGEAQLREIAEGNGGRFHSVEVDPAAVKAARANPINRNSSRGPVWGLKLPAR